MGGALSSPKGLFYDFCLQQELCTQAIERTDAPNASFANNKIFKKNNLKSESVVSDKIWKSRKILLVKACGNGSVILKRYVHIMGICSSYCLWTPDVSAV